MNDNVDVSSNGFKVTTKEVGEREVRVAGVDWYAERLVGANGDPKITAVSSENEIRAAIEGLSVRRAFETGGAYDPVGGRMLVETVRFGSIQD